MKKNLVKLEEDLVEKFGINIDTLEKKILEREEIIKDIKVRIIAESIKGAGKKRKLVCLNCKKEFLSGQFNYNVVPRVCKECKIKLEECILCGKKKGIHSALCGKCFNKYKELFKRIKNAHKKQGRKMTGGDNPAKKKENRKKISDGLREMYKNNPEFKEERVNKLIKAKQFGNEEKASKLERLVINLLHESQVSYKYEPRIKVGGRNRFPDFVIGEENVAIEVAGFFDKGGGINYYIKKIEDYLEVYKVVIIATYPEYVSQFRKRFRNRSRVEIVKLPFRDRYVELENLNVGNVDYGHWLKNYNGKCKMYHWHTSWQVDIKVGGYLKVGESMLIDYSDLKSITKEVLNKEIDHKTLIEKDFVKASFSDSVFFQYDSDRFRMGCLPEDEVTIIDFIPTAENIVYYLVNKIMDKLPSNIIKVRLIFREGVNNIAITELERQFDSWEEFKKAVCFYDNLYNLKIERKGLRSESEN